jgi:NADPH-dependent curcumin reductase CurA
MPAPLPSRNRQIHLVARPRGYPRDSDFRLVEAPLPEPGPDQVLLRGLYLSLDPYMRGRMNDRKSYVPPFRLNEVLGGDVVGEVLRSNSAQFRPGDIVQGLAGWQEFAALPAKGLRKVDPSLAPISTAVGVLGMPGLTAYFGLLDVGQPKAGDTVVVSGAAGAVGSIVGQIAKIHGCRAVGIAGGADKVRHCMADLGYDAAIDYKAEDVGAALDRLCPNGVDVYFDNVGGSISDAVVPRLNSFGRVALCGQISQYNLEKPEPGPRLWTQILIKQARVQGFLVFSYADRYREGAEKLAEWVKAGRLRYRETITDGIENAPRAFIGMLHGANTGKQLVRLAPDAR